MNDIYFGLAFVSCAVMIAAAGHDLATRSIPNWMPACLSVAGLLQRVFDGTVFAGVAAALLVFAGMFGLWLFRFLGGGDVKLAGAAALAVAPMDVGRFVLTVALAGGCLALIYLALSKVAGRPAHGLRRSLSARLVKVELWRIRRRGPLPYGVAIAFGGVAVLFSEVHPFFPR